MNTTHVPAITYHQILSEGMSVRVFPRGSSHYSGQLFLNDFVRQMDHLVNHGFTSVTHRDIYRWLCGSDTLPPKPVLIDFDDHSMISYKNALPVMRERGLRATMFVVSGLADGDPSVRGDMWSVARMRWRELEKLVDAGWLIGAHTRTHLYLGSLPQGVESDALIMWELVRGRVDIETNLGIQADHFAYPNGSWNEHVEGLVKQVYRSARLFHAEGPVRYITGGTDAFRLPTMNIGYQISFESFRKIVDRTDPDFSLELEWDNPGV